MAQAELGNLTQSHEIHLGVRAGGGGTAVAEMIANLLERQTLAEKMRRAGVTQCMRAPSGTADAQRLQG